MLNVLIWFPCIAAVIVALLPQAIAASRVRFISLCLSAVTLLWTLWLVSQFDLSNPTFQFRESLPWLPYLGLNYELGVDGLSLPLLGLNSLLTWIAIYSSRVDTERSRLFYSLILLISGGVAGAFLAQNLLLFFLFYEVELIPFYLLISVWGGTQQGSAATKFLLYTATSGGLILAGFLGIIWFSDTTSFTYETLLGQTLPLNIQYVLLILLLLGFGIKTPLVPLHTWLPETYVAASTPVAILLGGVLAKLGTYGIFRFCMVLFPEAWAQVSPGLATWAVVSVLYGALAAIAQKDIKRMVAYSSVGHMGYVLLAAAARTELSFVGAISQMFAHGLILALLFHLVGLIEAKAGTRDLEVLNGLMNPIRGLPLVSALLVLGGMASAGIPGLVGFIAEFLVFQGSYATFPIQTLISVVGTGLTAVYFVILLNRTCFGKLDNDLAYFPKVNWSERIPALILVTLIVVLGLQPAWLVRWSEPTTSALMAAAQELTPMPRLFTAKVLSHQSPPLLSVLEDSPST
ncbi:MAG: NADH-quinone oxidoreductase subunit M [Acaryochloridaceae cyanobacterium CSU_3_4]|nr:NADH-quinone oxidoreductase subunit M [Acaryochloridaceae cyanobacterium CSU_3_4]